MKFIKYKDGPHWWEWDTENMMAYNYHGGHHNIDENALGDAIYCECASWHDLYKKTGYCALETGMLPHTAWLAPDGRMFVATASLFSTISHNSPANSSVTPIISS